MNAEELKQLKEGDAIFIRAKFKKVWDDGNVDFTHTCTNLDDEVVKTSEYTHSSNVIIPPSAPKYDPCRPFKKGDKVKRREEIQGRKISQFVTSLSPGKVYTVVNDEFNCTVDVEGDDGLCICSFLHLELVTPVEELEPYFTKKDKAGLWWEVWKRDEEVGGLLVAYYSEEHHPNAKAAAEAECARLNAEPRKEQK